MLRKPLNSVTPLSGKDVTCAETVPSMHAQGVRTRSIPLHILEYDYLGLAQVRHALPATQSCASKGCPPYLANHTNLKWNLHEAYSSAFLA